MIAKALEIAAAILYAMAGVFRPGGPPDADQR